MRRFYTKLFVLILFSAGSGLLMTGWGHTADSIWAPPALADIISEGIANNQGLKSQAAKVEGLKAEAMAAGVLDDPRIGLGLLNLPVDTFSFSQEPMTQKQIFVAQKIPWPGKLSLKSQYVALKAVREATVLEEKKLNLSKMIAVAFYDLEFVSHSLEINERLTEMVRRLSRVSETRYSVGKGLQQDVLQAQVELSRLLDENITLKQKRKTLENRINELLSRKTFSPIPTAKDLVLPEFDLNIDELTAAGLNKNPGLVIRQVDINSAQTDVELARKNYYPDFDVKLAYGQREENRLGNDLADFASASVMMSIPLWKHKKQDNRLAAAKKRLEAKELAYQNLATGLSFQIDALANEINSTRENYRLFNEGVIVQAEQWTKSSQSAYQVNKIEFNTMINSQIRLLRFRLQLKKYLYLIYKQLAQLEEMTGGPIIQKGLLNTNKEDVK
jgi:cobalt-zinc-cadmium efflux system outer membrane protein